MTENSRLLTTKLRDALAQLPYLPRAVALVWAAARCWTIAWTVLLLVQGVLPVATVYLTRAVVDSLVATMKASGDWAHLRPTLILVALMAGIMLLMEVLRSVSGWVRTAQSELVQDHVSTLIHDKAMSLDLASYETPEYYDRLYRAHVDAMNRPIALVENIGSLMQNGITLIAMAGVLIPFGLWVPAVLGGEPAPGVLRRLEVHPASEPVAVAQHRRRAPHQILRLDAHVTRSGRRAALVHVGRSFPKRFSDTPAVIA